MRTTLQIDDEVLETARHLAAEEGLTVGQVVSRLARRGLEPRPHATRQAFPVFDVPANAAPITSELVKRALDD